MIESIFRLRLRLYCEVKDVVTITTTQRKKGNRFYKGKNFMKKKKQNLLVVSFLECSERIYISMLTDIKSI